LPPLLRLPDVFLPLLFEDFAALFGLAPRAALFDFELFDDLLFWDEARALEALPLFFAFPFALPPDFPVFFVDFFPLLDWAFAATALIAFFAFAPEEREAAARPANAPMTPPTTVPTGPATLPITAPVAAPAVCLEIGGISMFSEDELDGLVDR
jgi:hypothetical protein